MSQDSTTNQAGTPAPFHAIRGDYSFRSQPRYGRVVEIVRETRTQWIEADGTRWWKKNNREVGNTPNIMYCLLYTSDAADDTASV